MIAVFKYIKGCHRKKNEDLFSRVYESKIRTNGWKVFSEQFKVEMRNFLTVRALNQ